MAVRRLNHAVLYVNGLDREVDFYTKTLGFEVRAVIEGRAAFLRAPESANDHDLGLFEIGAGQAPDRPQVGLYHLAWEVATLGDLVQTRASLVAAGALWSGRATTGCPSRCTPRTRAGIEFEGAVAGARAGLGRRTGQRGAGTVALTDWDATLARWGADHATGAAAGSPT